MSSLFLSLGSEETLARLASYAGSSDQKLNSKPTSGPQNSVSTDVIVSEGVPSGCDTPKSETDSALGEGSVYNDPPMIIDEFTRPHLEHGIMFTPGCPACRARRQLHRTAFDDSTYSSAEPSHEFLQVSSPSSHSVLSSEADEGVSARLMKSDLPNEPYSDIARGDKTSSNEFVETPSDDRCEESPGVGEYDISHSHVCSTCCLEYVESSDEAFVETIFQECAKSSSSSPPSSSTSQGYSNDDGSNGTPPSSSASSKDKLYSNSASNKRRRYDNNKGESNNPNRDFKRNKSNSSYSSTRESHRGQRLACPLHIFHPEKYCKNNVTGKKYDACSGPGWHNMHYLKQHLGNSASSVHRKIRCPRCHTPFKTAAAVLKHQDPDAKECIAPSQPSTNQDDISKMTWMEIDRDVSRIGFQRLPASVREEIDVWVLTNLDSYAPNETVETRKGELRKWYMTWRILFPGYLIPIHPFYDEDAVVLPSKTELLVKTFKETIESGIESGDIEGINDENLEKLQEYLRLAISSSSRKTSERNLEHDGLIPFQPWMDDLAPTPSADTGNKPAAYESTSNAAPTRNMAFLFACNASGNDDSQVALLGDGYPDPLALTEHQEKTSCSNQRLSISSEGDPQVFQQLPECLTDNVVATQDQNTQWDMFDAQIQSNFFGTSSATHTVVAAPALAVGYDLDPNAWEKMFEDLNWNPGQDYSIDYSTST